MGYIPEFRFDAMQTKKNKSSLKVKRNGRIAETIVFLMHQIGYPTANNQIPPSFYLLKCNNRSSVDDKDRLVVVPVAEGNTSDDSSSERVDDIANLDVWADAVHGNDSVQGEGRSLCVVAVEGVQAG